MAYVLTPQCNFLYRYFWCQLLEDTIDKRLLHATNFMQPWTSRYHPYPSLINKMKTSLELKDQVANPPQPSPTYPERQNMMLPQKVQTSKGDNSKEMKKRSKTHQTTISKPICYQTWPIPPSKESISALAKQKIVVSDLPISKTVLTRKMAISHPLPFVQKESATASNPATTNIMAAPNMQYPGKRCKLSCSICV